MLDHYVELMTTLGVFILIILLLVIIPMLISIRKRQSKINLCITSIEEAIAKLNENAVLTHELLVLNFKDVVSKLVILDSKQMSVKDLTKDIAQMLSTYHGNTINAIKELTKRPNKAIRKPKTPTQRYTPAKVK
jgi:hypothetical protein